MAWTQRIDVYFDIVGSDHHEEYRNTLREWKGEGRIDYRDTVADGLENAP